MLKEEKMKKLKAVIAVIVSIIIAFASISYGSATDDKGPGAYITTYAKTSKDGRYLYSASPESDGIYFVASTQKNITVLKIPDEIDGKKVTGVWSLYTASPAVSRVEYGKNVKVIKGFGYQNDAGLHTRYRPEMTYEHNSQTCIPLMSAIFNEGLEIIEHNVAAAGYKEGDSFKLMVFPSTLKNLKSRALDGISVDNIIFQSDAELSYNIAYSSYATSYSFPKRSIYFTGNCLNANPFAFNYAPWINDGFNERECPYTFPPDNVTIYKKTDALGFEKFETTDYEEYTTQDFQIEPPEFEVKTYDNEWWNNIKEVKAITLSAAGITEDSSLKAGLSAEEKDYVSNTYTVTTDGSDNITFNATTSPSDAYDSRVYYVSLNENVAKVDKETGKVNIVGDGTATIRCVSASGVFSDCVVKVNLPLITKIINAIQNFFFSISNSLKAFINSVSYTLFKKTINYSEP